MIKNIIKYIKFKKLNTIIKFKTIRNISYKAEFGRYVKIGDNVYINSNVKIGDYSYCNCGTRIDSGKIGRFCSISYDCIIGANEHPTKNILTHPITHNNAYKNINININNFKQKNVPIIMDNVWIGAKCVIMRGITIGEGAIIAAGSVVTKDVAPYTIVGGIPAKVIKEREVKFNLNSNTLYNMTTDEILVNVNLGNLY